MHKVTALAILLLLFASPILGQQWTFIAPMKTSRAVFNALQLNNGKILVTGGVNSNRVEVSSELYNISSDTWENGGDMNIQRQNFPMVKLLDGRVYIPSGLVSMGTDMTDLSEIYNPTTKNWSLTTSVLEVREGSDAILLPNGKVLIVAGDDAPPGHYRETSEIFDPITQTQTFTGSISQGQFGNTLFYSPDSAAIIQIPDHFDGSSGTWVDRTEEYDIAKGTWTGTANSASPHGSWQQQALQLPSSEIIAPSGGNAPNSSTPLIEIYSPVTKTWRTIGNVRIPRVVATTAYIGGDSVLLVGGFDYVNNTPLADCEIINIKTGEVTKGPSLNESRYFHRLVTTREKDIENPCVEIFKVYVFGGETSVGSSRSSCEMIEFRRGAEGTLAMPDSLLLSASICTGGIDTTLSITNGACFPIVIDSVKLFALGKGSLSFVAPASLDPGKNTQYHVSVSGTKADSVGGVIRVYYSSKGVQSSKTIPVTAILRGATNTLSLPTTLNYTSTVCDEVDTTFAITSNSCIGLRIDSARVEGMPYSFVSSTLPVTLKANESQSLGFSLHSSNAGISSGKIRIFFNVDGVVHDTTIIVIANLRASIRASVRAIINDLTDVGDTVEVPLYLNSNSGETIDGFDLSLRYNTNLLSPLAPKFTGTLVEGASLYDQTMQSWGNTLYVPFPFQLSTTKPLVILRFKTYVTKDECTVLHLDRLRFAPDDPKFQNCLLAVANDSATICRKNDCGERNIRYFLRGETAKISSAHYDAPSSSIIVAHTFDNGEAIVTLTDALGRVIEERKIVIGNEFLRLQGLSLRSGVVFLRLRQDAASAITPVVISK